jgi:hypothetical protein
MPKSIARSTFLAKARSFKRESIDVDGIGTVFVREVSAAEAREQNKRATAADADELVNMAWLVSQVLCDEHGARLLTDGDLDAIKAMPIRVLKQIGDSATRLSAAKKNETSTTPPSGSPSNSAAS